MNLSSAFKIVLDLAHDTERDCSYDSLFRKGIGPVTLAKMREAIKIVETFVDG